MSYSQMQSVAAMPAREQHVQGRQLQSLVERLGWSYVALWSLNHQTRNLGWKGGHFRVNSNAVTGHGGTEVWNEQLFDSTYKSCQFSHGLGSVGTAHAEGRNIWMNGPSVLEHAGSKEQADFLQHARIATAMCIPWTDGVLELGTCEIVSENPELMETIRQHLLKNIVPALGQPSHSLSATMHTGVSQAPPNFPQSSLAPRSMLQQHAPFSSLNPLRHTSENLNTTFEPNSLNQQIRRTASLSSLNTDMFLQQPEDGTEGKEVGNELDTDMLLNPDSRTWRLPTTRAPDSLQTQQAPISATVTANQAFQYSYPPAQQSARGQYRSRSGTTSSSVSSLEDGSAKHSVDSPEQNMTVFGASTSQRRTSHSNTSSSPRRGTSSHSPEMNQLEDTTTKTGAPSLQETAREDDDIQTAFSLMLAEGEEDQEQWRNIYSPLETGNMSQMNILDSSTTGNNNSFNAHVVGNETQGAQTTSPGQTQGPFKSWRHTRILAPILQKNDRTNQELLRRCIDMMKQIPNLQQGVNQNEGQVVVQNIGQQGPRVASSSSPETVPDIGITHDPFDQPGSSRVQRRARGGSRIASMGPVHTGHDEAAMNHMMAERRRRVKQKENFTALRRLVPIISKADKASILGDAIVYLKDLQEQIRELEASRADTQRRFANLQVSYKDLEQRNKELEAMAASASAGTHNMQRSTRGLHSMQSF